MGLGFSLGILWGLRRLKWAIENPPPYPPNYIITADHSTGVPPPPFPRHHACPLQHVQDSRCRLCERLIIEAPRKD